jgi:hypothetical protein
MASMEELVRIMQSMDSKLDGRLSDMDSTLSRMGSKLDVVSERMDILEQHQLPESSEVDASSLSASSLSAKPRSKAPTMADREDVSTHVPDIPVTVSQDTHRENIEETLPDGTPFPTDDEPHVESRRSSKPRKTMFMQEVKTVSEMSRRHNVVMNMPSPDFSHIFLKSTELSEYASFVIKWFDFETRHGIKLEPAKIISKKVRDLLMYNHGIDTFTFGNLTAEETCHLMSLETKVLTKVAFAKTLKGAIENTGTKVLSWSGVTPETHELFFQGILMRKDLFQRTFGIMMQGNDKFCPSLEGKDFGLAHIFLSFIDRNYNKVVLAEILPIRETNYKSIGDFIKAYVKQAKSHYYEVARTIKLIPYDTKDESKPSSVSKDVFPKPPGRPDSSSKQFIPYHRKPPGRPDSGTLHHMENEDYEDEIYHTPTVVDHEYVVDHECVVEDEHVVEDTVALSAMPQSSGASSGAYSNTHSSSHSNTQSSGCINFALYGNCFKGAECKHAIGHNAASAARTRKWMSDKIQAFGDGK